MLFCALNAVKGMFIKMNNIKFEGIYSATFSLYDENMNVLKNSVKKLIDYNIKNGVKGFYVGGNTGECTVLPNKTRKQMLETVKENVSENTQIIAHIGAGHFDDTKDLILHANGVGVDAIASLPPSLTSYYKPNEIIEYYRCLASLSSAPVIAYVTSVLTCDVQWFTEEIMKIDNVIGIKLTVPNYYLFERVKRINSGNINILNGPDECMLAGLIMGADGAIGTTYNIIPKTACAIYDNFKKGNVAEALEYQHKLNSLVEILAGNNMATWKTPLTLLGIDVGYTVAPAKMPSEKEIADIIEKLKLTGCEEIK